MFVVIEKKLRIKHDNILSSRLGMAAMDWIVMNIESKHTNDVPAESLWLSGCSIAFHYACWLIELWIGKKQCRFFLNILRSSE